MENDRINLALDNPDAAKCWLISFEGHCRSKQIEDKLQTDNTSPKTNRFLEKCDAKTLLKLMSLIPDKNIENLLYSDIKKVRKAYIEPQEKLVIAERTNFLQITQAVGESEADYLARINLASTTCKWADLKDVSPADELIKTKFIAGLRDENLKLKILEKLQTSPKMTISQLINFCQMRRQLNDFVYHEEKNQHPPENFVKRLLLDKMVPTIIIEKVTRN